MSADKTFFLKVQDVIRCAVDEARFMLTVDKMREATQIPLKHAPVKAVELLADKFQLTKNERGDIIRQLFMGADNSRYGLVNAVTAASKITKSYERATELERIGSEILSLPISHKLLPPTMGAYQKFPNTLCPSRQAVHSINVRHTQGSILSEERLKDEITSGQFDLFGKILDSDDGVLGDLKVTSNFKLMKSFRHL